MLNSKLVKTKRISNTVTINTKSYNGLYYGEFGSLNTYGISGTVISVYIEDWGNLSDSIVPFIQSKVIMVMSKTPQTNATVYLVVSYI